MGQKTLSKLGSKDMQGYNVLMVYNQSMNQLLMCKRLKDPYEGLSNLVGGKIESGESGSEAAYREFSMHWIDLMIRTGRNVEYGLHRKNC